MSDANSIKPKTDPPPKPWSKTKRIVCVVAAVFGVLLLTALVPAILGSLTMRVPSSAFHIGDSASIEGNTAKVRHKVNQSKSAYTVGEEVSGVIYSTAKAYPNVSRIEVTVELDNDGLKDKYGSDVKGPLVMGTVEVTDLDEIRKYADAFSYFVQNKEWYEFQIKSLTYANALRKD